MPTFFPSNIFCLGVLQAVLDCTIKGSLLIVMAWMLTLVVRNRSAHLRSHIWSFTLVGLVMIPVLTLILPVWQLPLLPDLADMATYLQSLGRDGADMAAAGPDFRADESLAGSGLNAEAGQVDLAGIHWTRWALLAVLVGALATAVWIGLSRLALQRIVRRAEPLEGPWRSLLESLSGELHLRRRVRLLKATAVRAGITVGTFRPLVILPADAEDWSPQRRRLTISHELAHVKRRDALVEDLAVVVLVLHWFNPLVWLAIRRLRIEREMDCDNHVLNAGAKPSDYAMQLMEIASDMGSVGGLSWQAAGLAENTNLRDRLLHILNPRASRSSSRVGATLIAGLLLLAVALPLAATDPWHEVDITEEYKDVALKGKQAEQWTKLPEAKKEGSAAYQAEKMIAVGDVDLAIEMLRKLLIQAPEDRRYYIDEKQINTLGYSLMTDKKIKSAIEVFELNVEAFPKAWNTYDSLGEAYLKIGDLERARKQYKISLKLGSENEEKAKQALDYIDKTKASKSGT